MECEPPSIKGIARGDSSVREQLDKLNPTSMHNSYYFSKVKFGNAINTAACLGLVSETKIDLTFVHPVELLKVGIICSFPKFARRIQWSPSETAISNLYKDEGFSVLDHTPAKEINTGILPAHLNTILRPFVSQLATEQTKEGSYCITK